MFLAPLHCRYELDTDRGISIDIENQDKKLRLVIVLDLVVDSPKVDRAEDLIVRSKEQLGSPGSR